MVTVNVRVRIAGLLAALADAKAQGRMRPEIADGFIRDLSILKAEFEAGEVDQETTMGVVLNAEVAIHFYPPYQKGR